MEKIIELIIDEQSEISGIEAISVVENPAIEEDFIALKEHKDIKLAEVDAEQRILMGPALIPNKKIFRKGADDDDNDYYIYFSEETVKKASELFFIKSKHQNSTFEHSFELSDMSVVESWLIEDPKNDKASAYGFDLPKGTWMVSMKVNNDEIWEEYVKSGKVKGFSIEGWFMQRESAIELSADLSRIEQEEGEVKGFSIEGYFADGLERPKESIEENLCNECLSELNAEFELAEVLASLSEEVELESYGGYPQSARNNAKRGIKYNEAVNNKCATQVGKVRARQLEAGENFTLPTLKRIYSYLSRASAYYQEGNNEACGTISYLLWGGKSMLTWVTSKLKGLDAIEAASTIIDGRAAYTTQEEAEKAAEDIGCSGYHTHEYEGDTWYMPCEEHNLKAPCQDGYEQIGMKDKDGRKVPNCVPIK